MQITESQMAAFEHAGTHQFARRLCRYIEAGFSGRPAASGERIPGGEELESRVLELVSVASRFDVRSELAVGQFVVLGIAYARDFHRSPRVAELLGDLAGSPDLNMQRVLNAVIVAEARGA